MRVDCNDLSVTIDGRTIFGGVTVSCPPGTLTALAGPSGSGKTTLLQTLGLLVHPGAGDLLIEGVRANDWTSRRRRGFWRQHAGFLLQDSGIIEDESVEFNVTLSVGLMGRRAGGNLGKAQAALRSVGIGERQRELASHLSGGEKQRLGVARAIYKNAAVLFADEPTASLDPANQGNVIELLRGRAEAGGTVIVATHDIDLISTADAVVTLPAR
ncbi:MAG: ATP-binding cassette domain-containing protein [Bifidobacteriaceae bacterium]|jgi:putative ABC transport system ATP-binding protein|nr:ATP-binding cassette domain-containing protein [Bifidobacteriaceae bacterium]